MLLYPCHHLLVMLHILLTHHPQYWTLGQHMEYLCKLIGTTQATCVFFSGFSILLIAVDRFMFIVHPAATQISTKQVREHQGRSGIQSFVTQAFILSCVTLFISTFLSSPLFFLTKLDVKETLMDETYSYCYEVRPHYEVQSLTSNTRTGTLLTVGSSTPSSASSSSTSYRVWSSELFIQSTSFYTN